MSTHFQAFFAPPERGVYCCLHRRADVGRTGALIVQPLFGEYIQHHRTFFLLAEQLAERGIPSLRYDHYGTGDSAGDLPEVMFRRWTAEVATMAALLVDNAAVERLVIVAARFGAALALAAIPRIVSSVGLVLWEPTWSGKEFLAELQSTHNRVLPAVPLLPEGLASGERECGGHDVLGFEIPARLWNEIDAFEPDLSALPPDLDVLLIGSSRAREGGDRLQCHERLFSQPVEYPAGWLDPERGMYDVLVPAKVLAHLTAWIEAGS